MAAATYLVHKGVAFRTAHEIVGNAVRHCLSKGCELNGLTLEELREFSPAFEQDFFDGDHPGSDTRLPRRRWGRAILASEEALGAR